MHLVITKGNRKGLVFPLEGRPVSIGRDPGATITLDENRASRNHAIVEPAEGGGWMIRDLGSTNRTFLNGKPVQSAVLKEGDMIRIAGTEMRFQETLEEASPGEISLSMDPQSIQMALRNSREITATQSLSEALFQVGMLGDLQLGPDEFLSKALQVVSQGIRFSGWAWIDWPEGMSRAYRLRGERNGRPMDSSDVAVSQTLLDRVMRGRRGLTSSDLEGQFEQSMALRSVQVVSALAVPLLPGDRAQSILYLDREEGGRPFTRDDLEWVAVLGSQIAIHLENIALFRRLQEAFEELRRSQKELVRSEKLAAIGRLASGFAHDLNNPLGSLLGFIELALRTLPKAVESGSPAKVPEYLSKARDSADYCRALSRNLLAFAREKPFGGGEYRSFSVKETIDGTLNICHASLVRSNAQVEVEVPEGIELSGDPSTLQQVVMNLVTNAADAIAEVGDTETGCVRVAVEKHDDGVKLTVEDNGPGIPKEIASRVFDALFTTKKDDRGTGLGLYVVRRIVEESGGTISFAPRDSGGTCFTVILPQRLARLGTDEIDPSTAVSLLPEVEETT